LPRSKGAAAALDFFIWGSGHAFLGYRKALGLPWVLWTLILGGFLVLDAFYNQNLYYVTETGFSYGVAYNYGAAATVLIIPYLIVGGLMIFDLMRKGAIAPIAKFAAPRAESTTVAATQAPAARAVAGMTCPSCGVPVTQADTFCPSCGTRLQAAPPAMPTPVAAGGSKVCNNCGTPNPSGFVFCKRCGNKLTPGA
jgi:hypothetical protein